MASKKMTRLCSVVGCDWPPATWGSATLECKRCGRVKERHVRTNSPPTTLDHATCAVCGWPATRYDCGAYLCDTCEMEDDDCEDLGN